MYVYKQLSNLGYKVWYDEKDMGHNLTQCMSDGIKRSKVVLVFLNELYQKRDNCRLEMKLASDERKPIIAVFIQPDMYSKANHEAKQYLEFGNGAGGKMFVNALEDIAIDACWGAKDPNGEKINPPIDKLQELNVKMESLRNVLEAPDIDCTPSLPSRST